MCVFVSFKIIYIYLHTLLVIGKATSYPQCEIAYAYLHGKMYACFPHWHLSYHKALSYVPASQRGSRGNVSLQKNNSIISYRVMMKILLQWWPVPTRTTKKVIIKRWKILICRINVWTTSTVEYLLIYITSNILSLP